jgi:hypothetical protein
MHVCCVQVTDADRQGNGQTLVEHYAGSDLRRENDETLRRWASARAVSCWQQHQAGGSLSQYLFMTCIGMIST